MCCRGLEGIFWSPCCSLEKGLWIFLGSIIGPRGCTVETLGRICVGLVVCPCRGQMELLRWSFGVLVDVMLRSFGGFAKVL